MLVVLVVILMVVVSVSVSVSVAVVMVVVVVIVKVVMVAVAMRAGVYPGATTVPIEAIIGVRRPQETAQSITAQRGSVGELHGCCFSSGKPEGPPSSPPCVTWQIFRHERRFSPLDTWGGDCSCT